MDSQKISQKLQLASDLFEMSFRVKYFQMKKKFPDLKEQEIKKKVYDLIERGCS